VVSIDDVFEKKIDMLDAHVSQFYEWLPWTVGQSEQVPKDPAQRKKWLLTRKPPVIKNVNVEWWEPLEKRYGAQAKKIIVSRQARRMNSAQRGRDLRKLFPFFSRGGAAPLTCSPVQMVFLDIWESPDDAADFRRIALGLRAWKSTVTRDASFSCRRQEIASLPPGRLRKSDADVTAGRVCGGGARDFLADSWRLGKDGTHAYSPGGSERGCVDGLTRKSVETAH
jgi:hypothetical protein